MRTSNKANMSYTEGKVYYCNLSERYIREYNQEQAVRELIEKQNKKGTIGDWLKPYREEYEQICDKRLTRLSKEELTREIMRTAIPMRMLLDTKRDGRLKARLVALGYREPKEWDTMSTSSPVADLSSIRTLIYRAGDPDDVLSAIDVSVAFLQANPYHKDDVKRYVSYKPYSSSETLYYHLRGPIYGMRSGSRLWYNTLSEWLESEGYKKQHNEPCLFINDKGFTVLTYVDDLICRGSESETDRFYKLLNKRFECKDEVILTPENRLSFLGFDITCEDYDEHDIIGLNPANTLQTNKHGKVRMISMDQHDAIETFLSQHNVKPSKSMGTPMGDKNQLIRDPTLLVGGEVNEFQSKLGTINYFALTTRYDIAYPSARLSQFMSKPTKGANLALSRIMSYLRTTNDFKIRGVFSPKVDILLPYSDSDWAGDMPITSCSHSGTIITLNDTPIRWKSKKQPKTSNSSAEAEIYALAQTIGETRHLGWKMSEFNMNVNEPHDIYVDNTQSMSFSKNITVNSKLRTTFNLKDKRIQEMRNDKIVDIKYVKGIENPADLLTKVQPAYKHKLLMKLINKVRVKPNTGANTDPNTNPNPNSNTNTNT